MTTITLGAGPAAIEVESGAFVPLVDRKDRGVVIGVAAVGCPLLQTPNSSVWHEVHAQTGELVAAEYENGIRVAIDLAALRRERAPSSATSDGWTSHPLAERHPGNWLHTGDPAVFDADNPERRYWTHRPGNAPAKQAAFDAAVESLMRGAVTDYLRTARELIDAARALGYGVKR